MATFGRTGVTSFVSRKDPDKEDSGIVEEDVRKVSVFFINSLHHNNGYFLTVSVDVENITILSITDSTEFQFVFCEILNMIVIVANIYLTDFFLEGRFMK